MGTLKMYLRAFRVGYTYNLRRNAYLWFGVLWGLPIPFFSIGLDASLVGGQERTLLQIVRDHPIHLAFLAHPALFGLVFGAMGTVRHELERENARLIAELRAEATTDPLTGIHNRRFALAELEAWLHRVRRAKEQLTVILFDLDKFKQVNEDYGHLEGDRVLQATAYALRSVTRQGEVLARYGGDEFLLIAQGNHLAGAATVERAREAVQRAAGLRISAGVAVWPEDGTTPAELIDVADKKLFRDKKRAYPSESSLVPK